MKDIPQLLAKMSTHLKTEVTIANHSKLISFVLNKEPHYVNIDMAFYWDSKNNLFENLDKLLNVSKRN